MSCTSFTESLAGRLYGENSAADDAALSIHLESCAQCRGTLDEFAKVRALIVDDEPRSARVPRVLVLRDRFRVRPALMAASLLGAAILAGGGAGLGFVMGRSGEPHSSSATDTALAAAATEDAVRREVDTRLAAWEASHSKQPAVGDTPSTASDRDAVSSTALRAELAKLERRMNGARAAELDYMLEQIAASEYRVANRIGKTNDALRTVALAGNPYGIDQ